MPATDGENAMKVISLAAALALLLPGAALAQADKMPGAYWAPKPATPTPYRAPNKPHWKLADLLAGHRGQTDWVQPIVRNPEQEADYISLGPGRKSGPQFYADDRIVFIVRDGAIRVSVGNEAPFTATRGFMVNVPARHLYTLETVSATPSLRFEIRQAGAPALYPLTEKPAAPAGSVLVKVTGTPGPSKDRDTNPRYLDFWKDVAVGDKTHGGPFVRDDHFTANVIRGKGVPVPPDSEKGHFHVANTEFWYIMEGRLGYKIEGFPYFEADEGDIVTAVKGRWHRATNSPNAPMSTRIPINPRPPILHNFEAAAD